MFRPFAFQISGLIPIPMFYLIFLKIQLIWFNNSRNCLDKAKITMCTLYTRTFTTLELHLRPVQAWTCDIWNRLSTQRAATVLTTRPYNMNHRVIYHSGAPSRFHTHDRWNPLAPFVLTTQLSKQNKDFVFDDEQNLVLPLRTMRLF